jgi:hypothetical protein
MQLYLLLAVLLARIPKKSKDTASFIATRSQNNDQNNEW